MYDYGKGGIYLPFFAIIIDLLTMGAYFMQVHNPDLRYIGLIFQGVMVILLLILVFIYRGKKFMNFRPKGYPYFTIRYAIIVFSFLINGAVLFLYILNYLDINSVVFSTI